MLTAPPPGAVVTPPDPLRQGFTRPFAEAAATKPAINNGWLKGRQRKLSVVTKEEFKAVKTPKQLSTLGNQVNYFVGVFDGKNLNVQQASRNEVSSPHTAALSCPPSRLTSPLATGMVQERDGRVGSLALRQLAV